MRLVLRLALLAALTTATTGLACGEEGPLDRGVGPSIRSLTGTWAGPIQHLSMRLTLTETDGSVVGSGTMTENAESFTLSVAGTVSNGAFSLTISEAEHESFTFTGNVQVSGAAATMVGIGNGSGLENEPITLTKQ
jgi:hypothetical protein